MVRCCCCCCCNNRLCHCIAFNCLLPLTRQAIDAFSAWVCSRFSLSFCIVSLHITTAYRVLGINKDASSSEIKKSYHKLALKHHPDKQNTDEDRARSHSLFAKIAGAYEILSDDDKRKEYDALQAEQKSSSGRSRGYDSNKFHVDFNDPYEVFKRAFQQQWGMEYPGSKYDYSDEPIQPQSQQRITNGDGKNQKKLLTNGGKDANESSTDKKGKTSKHNKSKNDNSKSAQAGNNSNDPNPGNGVLVVSDRHNPANQQLVVGRDPHDNRPTSIKTTTKEIKHKDGTVETITETTITRPDGSTETMQMTDKADKRKDWKKPNNGNNLLTNGEDSNPRRQITDGKNNKKNKPFFRLTNRAHNESGGNNNNNNSSNNSHKKPVTEKKLLRITNGSSSSTSGGTTTSKQKKEAAPEEPRQKRTGLFGRK